jgi:hypothetical protein
MARRLVIVGRDDVGLYLALRADWAHEPNVTVLLDRRVGQRRQEAMTATIERRRTDRRQQSPVETYLTWRGGGASARRSDVLAALNNAAVSIAVRQRPGAKAERRPALQQTSNEVSQPAAADPPLIGASTSAVVALVILLGTMSNGIVGGVALWLFMAYEFASRPHKRGAAAASPPQGTTWWPKPLQTLVRSYRSWAN